MMLKGQITAYSKAVRAGIIRTEDKVELHFSLSEWLSDCEPEVGMLVDFRRGPRQMTAIMVRHLTE